MDEKGERGEKSEMDEKGERGEKGEMGEKSENGEKSEKDEKSEKGEIDEKGEMDEKGERVLVLHCTSLHPPAPHTLHSFHTLGFYTSALQAASGEDSLCH
jgi:hypothetical protein